MISLIAAISQNLVIGNENKLLWHIPEDMRRFKRLTTGHPVIMGRRTYESIGRPLPRRTNIIISRNKTYTAPGCTVVNSVDEAIQKAKASDDSDEIFVIGGAQIYQQALPIADRLYLTVVRGNFSGDAYFPEYEKFFPHLIHEEHHEDDRYVYSFLVLERDKSKKEEA